MKNFEGGGEKQRRGLLFAAMAGSAAIVMALLLWRRALLLHQWRFLAVNLLFLAIVSLKDRNTRNSDQSSDECSKMAVEEATFNGGEDEYREMTKEELKQRAEDFIARFKMQLVSDQAKSTHSTRFVN